MSTENEPQTKNFAEPTENPDVWAEQLALSEVIHRVGHDIGNPLTAIISLSSILEFSAAPPEPRAGGLRAGEQEPAAPAFPRDKLHEYSSSIIREAWKVSHIVERLVMIFSDRTGNVVPCSVGEIAERCIQRLRTRHHLNDLKIESDFFFAPSAARVLADTDQLTLLVSELLLNAYTFQGPPEDAAAGRVVHCALEHEGPFVKLRFRNRSTHPYGAELADLFRPLHCGSDAPNSKMKPAAKGTRTGLGLSAVWAIVLRQGGRMKLEESTGPSGSEFTVHISLPVADAPDSLRASSNDDDE